MPNSQEGQIAQKQQQLLERARKGLLKYLLDNNGKRNLGQLHEYSMNTYLIQHQAFSQMMEGLVNDGFLMYDFGSDEAAITDKGQELARQS